MSKDITFDKMMKMLKDNAKNTSTGVVSISIDDAVIVASDFTVPGLLLGTYLSNDGKLKVNVLSCDFTTGMIVVERVDPQAITIKKEIISYDLFMDMFNYVETTYRLPSK
jgi:hypothetical protein